MSFGHGAGSILIEVLEDARARGYLGPGPVDTHIAHAEAFASATDTEPEWAVDLGSGGGIPGLVLALRWPASRWLFVEAVQQRVTFLTAVVTALGLDPRVTVWHGRTEDAGREPKWRGAYDLVVARSFGRPAVVAENAAPLLRPGGVLLVSDPPGSTGERWPREGVGVLGLELECVTEDPAIARLRQVQPCPDRFPRRAGVPTRRPLF